MGNRFLTTMAAVCAVLPLTGQIRSEKTLKEWEFRRDHDTVAMSGWETAGERLAMLRRRRNGILDEIHRKQEQLDRLDHLRFTLSRAGGK